MVRTAGRKARPGETDDAELPVRAGGGSRVVVCSRGPRDVPVDPILVSTGVVALAEIGDKTQLLAIVLAAKFRKPLPIILGILAATLLNHLGAAAFGYFLARFLSGAVFRLAVGAAFLLMAIWALVPDTADEAAAGRSHGGVFLTTLCAFFLVEMGDKTQIATSLLAARFNDITWITLGTTLGMMIANVPAVLLGEAITRLMPLRYVRWAAAAIFVAIGAWMIAAVVPRL
jgi:putative Ca2+/H+ antiporter (TMEM165/GDT1 family)